MIIENWINSVGQLIWEIGWRIRSSLRCVTISPAVDVDAGAFVVATSSGSDRLREWKGRKKDKTDGAGDGTSSHSEDFQKGYLRHSTMQPFTKNHQLRELIPVPNDVEQQEWLASQVIPFFHHVNLLYGAISEFCTSSTCPVMSAPNNTVYPWVDEKGRKSKCSAPQYIDYVTTSIEKLIRDESVFPTKYGQSFPPNFEVVLRRIMRQLFHVLAHLYFAHFDSFVQLSIHLYLNGLFAHFVLFAQHFNLIESRELEVLKSLVERIASDTGLIPEIQSSPERKTAPDSAAEIPIETPKDTVDASELPKFPEEEKPASLSEVELTLSSPNPADSPPSISCQT